jgi:hypothetical protein
MSFRSHRAAGALFIITLAACGRQAQVASPTTGSAPAPTPSISVSDGESLIRAMHARYNGNWPRMITYNQTTSLLAQSGQNSDQTWYVAISAPGRQRIDYVNPDLGNGMMVRADSTYFFTNGRQVRTAVGWNDLLLLTQDVYHQNPEVTISVLRSLGYQLSRMQSRSFDGRTTYVIGASSSTDSASRQFWVERDRLVLVRVREKRRENDFSDIRLGDFIKVGDGLIAKQTYQLQNGVPRLHQLIANAKVDPALAPDLFEPKLYSTVKHWSKP